MKKLLLTFAALCCGIVSFAAIGDTAVKDGVTYKVISDTRAEVSDVDTKLTDPFIIPQTIEIGGANYTVSAVGEEAFYWSNTTAVELPATVTEIKDMGFYSCYSLASVKLGNNVKSIGSNAFGYNRALVSIVLPEGLETIGTSAFTSCTALTNIQLPTSLKSLGTSCFYKCPFSKIALPENLEAIADKAFLNCSNLTEINVPASVKSIGVGAFYGTKIAKIELPAGLQSIGEEAFYNAPLTELVIPAGLTQLGPTAFSGTQIAAFEVADGNTAFCTIDGVLYSADKSLLYAFPPKSTVTELTLPAACVGINGGAFDRTGIRKVTVGNKFRAIDAFAFCQSELAQINMPESLVYIGEQAFAGTKLSSVILPSSLPMIQEAAFAECSSLTDITIPSSVKFIGIRTFYNCKALATVNCLGMTPATLDDWYEAYESPFFGIPSTTTVNVPVGTAAAYKASNWGQVFSTFNETLPAYCVPTAISPADGDKVSSFEGLTLTFGSDMTIVNRNPAITVTEGSLVAGVPLGNKVDVDEWFLTANSKTELRIWPADWDSYTAPFNMEAGKEYYITIPAGICKDAAGNLNDKMLIHYSGSYVAPKVELLSVTPANDTSIEEIGTLQFTFAEKVSLQSSKLTDIKVMKGAVDGTPVTVEKWWAVNGTTSGTQLAIFAGDEYDGFSMPVALEKNTDYYVILPAGLFRLSSSFNAANEEIVLHYTNGTGAVDAIGTDAPDAPVEYYNLNGVHVPAENLAPGLYIRRQGSNATKVYIK